MISAGSTTFSGFGGTPSNIALGGGLFLTTLTFVVNSGNVTAGGQASRDGHCVLAIYRIGTSATFKSWAVNIASGATALDCSYTESGSPLLAVAVLVTNVSAAPLTPCWTQRVNTGTTLVQDIDSIDYPSGGVAHIGISNGSTSKVACATFQIQ
jgi:hypothetical protein